MEPAQMLIPHSSFIFVFTMASAAYPMPPLRMDVQIIFRVGMTVGAMCSSEGALALVVVEDFDQSFPSECFHAEAYASIIAAHNV
jgi:hypothetical protein